MEDFLSQSAMEEFVVSSSDRHKKCKPPKEAYYFFPKGRDVIEWDPSFPKKTMRRIFEGGAEYNEFEKEILKEFQKEVAEYCKRKKKIIEFPSEWTEANTLRFIQGSGYNLQKAIDNLQLHFEWRKQTLPVKISNPIMEILNLGFIYGHGRDTNFRPIFIINARIFNKYLQKYSVQEWIESLVYFIEYMIQNMCIPGQVENWNIILDVADFSMVFIPSQLKTIFHVLMNNYRCRLYVMYIVNVSPVLNFLWNTIKGVLDTNTEKKIKLLKSSDLSMIFTFINPEQIEQRFGGKAPNVEKHYFPHIIPSQNFAIENDPHDKLMPVKDYLDFMKTNSKYSHSPFLDYNLSGANSRSLESNEEISKYEDAKSRSFTLRLNMNRSSRSIKTFYEDCEERIEEIKKMYKGTEIEFDLDKYSRCGGRSNEDSNKTRSSKKKVSFIRLENDLAKNSCCSINGSCTVF